MKSQVQFGWFESAKTARRAQQRPHPAVTLLLDMSLFLRRQVFTQLGGSRHGATAVRAAAALASSRQPVRRYSFSPESGLVDDWPISSANWILNVCPQGKRMIVERLGKMHHVHESGWFLAVPFVDRIAYIIDMRERAMEIPPQSCITRCVCVLLNAFSKSLILMRGLPIADVSCLYSPGTTSVCKFPEISTRCSQIRSELLMETQIPSML